MRPFGICMSGLEEEFERLVLKKANEVDYFTYIEIGVAYAGTLKAVSDIIIENGLLSKSTIIGIDIPNGWSLGLTHIRSIFREYPFQIIDTVNKIHQSKINLILKKSNEVIDELKQNIDFAFVDGCHGKQCVTRDFNSLDKKTKSGSIIIFHDAAKANQGDNGDTCWNCNPPGIRVFDALTELGLFKKHKKWRFKKWIYGNKNPIPLTARGRGNDAAVFVKI